MRDTDRKGVRGLDPATRRIGGERGDAAFQVDPRTVPIRIGALNVLPPVALAPALLVAPSSRSGRDPPSPNPERKKAPQNSRGLLNVLQ